MGAQRLNRNERVIRMPLIVAIRMRMHMPVSKLVALRHHYVTSASARHGPPQTRSREMVDMADEQVGVRGVHAPVGEKSPASTPYLQMESFWTDASIVPRILAGDTS